MSGDVTAAPEALWSGHASIYQAEDGGMILAYKRDGEEETFRHHVPGFLVSMAQRMSANGDAGMLSMLKGMVRGG